MAEPIFNEIKVLINNESLFFDINPYIVNGITIIPAKNIIEALGAKFQWQEDTQTITAIKNDITLVFSVGSKTVHINGIEKTLDVEIIKKDNTVLVPVRFISEIFGASVEWDDETSKINIYNGQVFKEKVWPNGPPDQIKHESEETVTNRDNYQNQLGYNRSYEYVSVPEITVYLPAKEKSNGMAAVICPGGGFGRVTIDREGYNIAKALNEKGIAGIVLKYRTKPKEPKSAYPAVADLKRTMKIVRSNAEQWNINPQKIGMIGFSAGGHLVATVGANYDNGNINDADIIEHFSCRPSFLTTIYPVITNEIEQAITNEVPTTFIAVSNDDSYSGNSINYYSALKKAKVPVELHVFSKGGHGFALGSKSGLTGSWFELWMNWINKAVFIN